MKHRKSFASCEESSSDEEILINLKKRKKKDDLYRKHIEKCEFCDAEFFNKYDAFVHNAQHMIIPLISLPSLKCTCGRYYSSGADLQRHNETDHHIKVPKIDLISTKQSIELLRKDLEKIINKEVVISCEDNLKHLFMVKNDKNIVKIVNNELASEKIDTGCEARYQEQPERVLIKDLEKIIKKEASFSCDDNIKNKIQPKNKREVVDDTLTKDLEKIVNKDVVVKCEDNLKNIITARNEKQLEKIVKKEAVVKCELLKDTNTYTSVCKAEIDKIETFNEPDSTVNYDMINGFNNIEIEFENNEPDSTVNHDTVATNKANSLRSKLVFEDDDDDEIFDDDDDIIQINSLAHNTDDNFYKLTVDLEKKIKEEKIQYIEESFESIHYGELMVPGDYECRKCSKIFPNRFDLIIHETSHMHAKRHKPHIICKRCDYYIAGNFRTLHRHISEKHPFAEPPNQIINRRKCLECGLNYYYYGRHHHNYHLIYVCPSCSGRFRTQEERTAHKETCKGLTIIHNSSVYSKLVKVCDLCFSFFKNTQLYRYVEKGVYSRDGLRTPCERCEKQFFELKLVERFSKTAREKPLKKICKTTNEERLKTIQKRLRMIQRTNKF